jgi:hypothetical protein
MTYRPREGFFGPPFRQRVSSLVHLAFALGLIGFVFVVERGPHDSAAYRYLFQREHLIDIHFVEVAFVVSSLSSMLRASMRGVRVRGDFVEYRELVGSLWPKVRRIRWAQIDRILLHESGTISLELWDGSTDFLPLVADSLGLGRVLTQVATSRAIPISGAHELDDLSHEDPEDTVD